MVSYPFPPKEIVTALRSGQVIPAHPLALTDQRRLDEKHQRALTRYYLDSGAGGVAVGVHTTQFEIRDPKYNLLQPVLELAVNTVQEYEEKHENQSVIRVAGVCGMTDQAVSEAQLARELGYHMGLLSLGAMRQASLDDLITHAQRVAREIPLMGFYLQPSVGGRILDYDFWRRFCEIPNLMAIKIAPFNRYQTIDVIRAVAESGRADEISLYTGNDDTIVYDLLSKFTFYVGGRSIELRFVGGLLGHWAFWTREAAALHQQIREVVSKNLSVSPDFLTLAWQITDVNAAAFDPAHQFAGCIPGIHEILRRQGLLNNRLCLNPHEELSPGQMEEIDRIYKSYPHLNDDEFIQENLDRWLR